MGIGGIVGDMDLADAGDCRRRLGDPANALPGNQQMHLAQLRSGGDRRQRGVLDGLTVMLDPNQRLHFLIPIADSFITSSSTSATLTPPCRLAGSTTFSVLTRGVTSTP